MKIIAKLSHQIDEEIEDAGRYAKCALKYKGKRKSLADTYYQLSTEEVRHANMLHTEVTKIIEEYRAKHGDPPEIMQQLYDYMHEQSMAKMNEVSTLQQMYTSN